VLELLGQGTFAKVKRGRDKATGQEFAIKIIGAQQRQITMEYSAVVD
jgi:serine/threonine protein kinase